MALRYSLLLFKTLPVKFKTVYKTSVIDVHILHARLSSATIPHEDGKSPIYTKLTQKISGWMQYYEDFIGLTEVKEAQGKVLNAEHKFMDTQERRRDRQQRIQQLQMKLKEIHAELDKTSRGEDRYLHLITQEHAIIREEKLLLEDFQFLEKAEREYFSALSLAVRESHEQERAQAEKTKYWSIIGSVCGAIIGIIGTSINNRLRMKELRSLVTDNSDPGKIRDIVNELVGAVQSQQKQVVTFLLDLRKLLGEDSKNVEQMRSVVPMNVTDTSIERLELQTSELVKTMERHDDRLASEMRDVKAMVAAQLVGRDATYELPAVYVGEDVQGIVKQAEKNLEWKMKINSLATVALGYGVLAVALPFIMQMFKGS